MPPQIPVPPEDQIRAADAGLMSVVRDPLPMGFYRGDDNWSLWSTGALTRMADTVDSAMALWRVFPSFTSGLGTIGSRTRGVRVRAELSLSMGRPR